MPCKLRSAFPWEEESTFEKSIDLRPGTSILRSDKEKSSSQASGKPPIAYLGYLDPVHLHHGPVPAVMLGLPSLVVITQMATPLNSAVVAWTVGARCSLPDLFLLGQMEPRQ